MPEIPYSGVPDRTPEFRPTPSLNVNPPEAAFGTNIAAATQHLGQVEEGAGKELFDRAYALQEMHEQSNALAAGAKSTEQMNNLFVDFKEKRGADAGPQALTAYQQGLDKVLADGKAGLSPYGQLLYDQEARTNHAKMLLYGSEHAADESKQYYIGSAKAAQASDIKGMELVPGDEKGNAAKLNDIRARAHDISSANGDPPGSPQYIKEENDSVNAAVIAQLRGMGQNDPVKALQLYSDAVNKKLIYGEDAGRIGQWLKVQRNTIGAGHNAAETMKGFTGGGPVLNALFGNESGGRNVVNKDKTTSSGQAQGFFQITTGTWAEFAAQAGVDTGKYPTAIEAPYEVQAQVASIIPLRRWDPTTIAAMQHAGAKLDLNKTLGQNLAANGESISLDGVSEKTVAAQARQLANSQFPGDEEFAEASEDRAMSQFNKIQTINRDELFRDKDTLVSSLVEGIGPDHKLPTSVDEFKLDPNLNQAWQALGQAKGGPEIQQQIMRQLAQNAKGDVALTPEREKKWQQLAGLSANDPQAFMSQTSDISKVDLPLGMKKQIIAWQRDIYKKVDANPQMSHAIGYLQRTGILSAAGLTKEQDQDGLNQFTGILHDIMSNYQLQNDKPMPDAEVEATATKLLQRTHAGWLGGSIGQGPQWFRSADAVPDEFKAKTISNPIWQGAIPSEDQIMKIWMATQYNDLVNPPKVGNGK
jgi:hypothetical protein